jgi:osmotically-inducible protein OsmY
MNKFTLLLGALGGAGLMYFLDPQVGRRRRALLRDQMTKLENTTSARMDVLAATVADRARGAVAETTRQLTWEDVSDETVIARMRSVMGRYVSHPGAITIRANNGHVTLTGTILAQEVQPFVAAVKRLPGVKGIDNQLQMHDEAGNIPDLQGGKTRTELRE